VRLCCKPIKFYHLSNCRMVLARVVLARVVLARVVMARDNEICKYVVKKL